MELRPRSTSDGNDRLVTRITVTCTQCYSVERSTLHLKRCAREWRTPHSEQARCELLDLISQNIFTLEAVTFGEAFIGHQLHSRRSSSEKRLHTGPLPLLLLISARKSRLARTPRRAVALAVAGCDKLKWMIGTVSKPKLHLMLNHVSLYDVENCHLPIDPLTQSVRVYGELRNVGLKSV